MARREEREATESAAADMLRRSARVLRTLEEACVRARAAPSTATPNLPACASSSPSPSHRGAPVGTFEPAAVDASFASGPLMFHARHHRGESLLGGDFNAETITVTFVAESWFWLVS